MIQIPNIVIPQEKIVAFCEKWHITEMALFGSVLRDDFRPESDVDVLVTFDENTRISLFDLVKMEDELKMIFGRNVDLGMRATVESNPNYIRRKAILRSLQVIYAA